MPGWRWLWGGIAGAEGWAETPGVHLGLQEHSLLVVEKVCPPRDPADRRRWCSLCSCVADFCKCMKFLIKWARVYCTWHSDCWALLWAAKWNWVYPSPFLVLMCFGHLQFIFTKAAEERSVRGDGGIWGDAELSWDCEQAHRPQVFLIPSALEQLTE